MISEDELKKWIVIAEKCASDDEEIAENSQNIFGVLTDLVCFLRELKDFIASKSNARAVLQEIPSVGKLLGILTQNYVVECSEEAIKALFQCILSLASHNTMASDSTTRKTITWAQSQIKVMASPSSICPASCLIIGQSIGNTATELTQSMTEKLVLSICHDLMDDGTNWNTSINDLAPKLKHHGLTLRHLSEMCLPLIDRPIAKRLVESLLRAGNTSTDVIDNSSPDSFTVVDCLSPRFLESVTEMTRQTQLDLYKEGHGYEEKLSYDALTALWRRSQPSFECQIFDLIDCVVVRHPSSSIQQMKDLMNAWFLIKACVEHIQLYSTALQIIYCFMYKLPECPKLHDVLQAFTESCAEFENI